MTLSATQKAVVDDLVGGIPGDVTWCVFGSANAALRGFEADPDDVDVLTTEAGAGRIRDAFEDAFVGSYEVGVSRVDEYRIRGEELEAADGED